MLVEIRIKETLETAVNIPFGFAFDLLCVNIETLYLEAAGDKVTKHLLGLITDEFLVAEHLLVVTFLHEFKPSSVESVDFKAVYVSPCMTQADLFFYDDIFAKADTFIVHVTFFALIVAEEKHLLPFVPDGNPFSWGSELGKKILKKVFRECFFK